MHPYAFAVTMPHKMLCNLLAWLDAAEAHAESQGFDPEVYVGSRLRPDMFPLGRQIQAAADSAKFLAARLAGATPPVHEDTEQTLAELRDRVQAVLAYLDGFSEADFEGAADRRIELGFLPDGTWARGADYALDFAIPNLMFHVTTTYAILRYNGVALGKRDFIGSMTLQTD